jgi:DNA-binding transcriptional ArsR family regulator
MARKTSVAASSVAEDVGGAASGGPDYEASDVLVVSAPEQLKALADDLRGRVVVLLRERARSVTDLAERLDLPKGTVAHHVKVLEKAGLIRVVRTRKVRAVTERYYGRTARLFLYEAQDPAQAEDVRAIVQMSLRIAAEEIQPVDEQSEGYGSSGVIRVRLNDDDARRFNRRVDRLLAEFREAEDPDGDPYGLAIAMYRRADDADA